jgi:hypothetical protein
MGNTPGTTPPPDKSGVVIGVDEKSYQVRRDDDGWEFGVSKLDIDVNDIFAPGEHVIIHYLPAVDDPDAWDPTIYKA